MGLKGEIDDEPPYMLMLDNINISIHHGKIYITVFGNGLAVLSRLYIEAGDPELLSKIRQHIDHGIDLRRRNGCQ